MSHVVDDIVNPVGAITGIDPVKQATGFTGTGFDKKPAQSSQGAQQSAPSGGGGGSSGGAGNMLSQLVGQTSQQQSSLVNNKFAPIQFSPAQVPQTGLGFGQQLSQLQPMQSAMGAMTKFFSQ